jgi:hypothetical protein
MRVDMRVLMWQPVGVNDLFVVDQSALLPADAQGKAKAGWVGQVCFPVVLVRNETTDKPGDGQT